MKKMLQKIFSILLAACFVLSVVPAPAAAAGNETTNGQYSNGAWSEGGTGSITYDNGITLSKTAKALGNNQFAITLQVQTSQTTSTVTNGGAVVLVMDVSGSMAYCADCGASGNRHDSGCPKSGSRMAAAKTAAKNFLESYAGTDASASRMLAIVTFATNYSTKLNWVNVAGGAGKNSYDAAVAAINGMSADGGTNLEGGLYQASTLLDSASGTKSVVLLTDGVPTYRINGGNGSDGSEANNTAAANRASQIKSKGADLYTVCFGVADDVTYEGGWFSDDGPTVGEFLSGQVASSGCAYNADNSAELYAAFAAITESITEGLDGVGLPVTDPMADMITVVDAGDNFIAGADNTYTWNLSNAVVSTNGNTTTYTYTYTYTVELNVQGQNFEEGKFFPTNKETYLTLADGSKLAFPVPGVSGTLPRTSISVTKVWDDAQNQDGLRPESVTVQLTENGVAQGEAVELNEDNGWSYTWTGLIKQSNGSYHNYSVQEVNTPAGYNASATNTAKGEETITLTNTHVPAVVSKTVTKVWNDNKDQDGKRPDSISVVLKADGAEKATVELNAANNWSYTWENLPEKAAGKVINYTVDEVEVPAGYDKTVNGLTITNSYTPETTKVEGTKTWDDDNNRDNVRPESITINLLADGQKIDSKTVTEADGWKWSFTNLPKYRDHGTEIVYTIEEVPVAEYDATVNGFNVTNTHTPATVTINGEKTWDDADNQDGKRPASITIHLMKGDEVVETKTVTAADGWKWSFTALKNENGEAIKYTIAEDAVSDYSSVVNGYNVTNTHTPETITISGTKTWDDADDQDGIRPDSITVQVKAGDSVVASQTVEPNEDGEWKYSISDLPKYANAQEIIYTVVEVEVDGYETTVDGYDITNKHTPATTDITVTKVWNDVEDQAGFRPDSVTVNLLANGEKVDTATITADTEWKYTFKDLPVNAAGNMITYTVTEEAVEHYTTKIEGFTIINTHVPTTVNVEGKKTWEDNGNQDGIRPESITINLLANGEKIDSKIVEEVNDWTWSFTDLPEYAGGEKIVYTITEEAVDGYTTKVEGYNVINTHEVYKTSVTATKVWDDADNQDGIRSKNVTVRLFANGEEIDSAVLGEKNDWTVTFDGLDVNSNGKSIAYSITEDALEGYTTSIVVGDRGVFTITNTHEPETVEVSGEKTWVDNNDQDGKRPESITINLLADGEKIDSVTVTAEDGWKWSFTDLPKFKVDEVGKEVKYTISEDAVDAYTAEVDGYNVTNTHEIEKTEVKVTKVWDDAYNQDGIRADEIVVELYANGVATGKTVTLKDKLLGEDWTATFENLDVYANGTVIDYTVKEAGVPEDYNSAITGNMTDGFTITNTHEVYKTEITVEKVWDDADDQDGIRPESVTVKLMAGKEVVKEAVLNEENKWSYTFTDLDVNAEGKAIKYTVEEDEVEGYEAKIQETDNGFVITNSHTPETIDEIKVTKVWDDADDQDGIRPEKITVNLLANGKIVASAELKATLRTIFTGDWTATFKDLDKYENGEEIVYTITENAVSGYETKITGSVENGFTVTNTHEPEMTKLDVQKFWKDDNNKEKTRADSVKITLYANGKSTGKTVTLNEKNQWFDSFENLPKYDNGKEIKYTVKEASLALYKASYSYNGTKAVVTNTLSEVPNTGDTSNVGLYLGLMGVCAVAAVALILLNKKKRNA